MRPASALLTVTLTLLPSAASGGPSAEADRLFTRGRALMGQKKHVEACSAFEKSYALEPALGTLLNLAHCTEILAKPVRAFVLFNEAAAWANRNKESKREEVALQRAQALKAKLPFVVVDLLSPPPGARATLFAMGSTEVLKAWSLDGSAQSVPLDAGRYEVEATAAGYHTSRTTFEVPAVPGMVKVAVQALRPLQPEKPAAQRVEVSSSPVSAPPLAQIPPSEGIVAARSPGRTIGIVSLTAGGVVGAASAVGLIYAATVFERAKRQQPGGVDAANPTVTRREYETASTLSYVSWTMLGVGAACVAGGTWLSLREEAPRPVVSAMVTRDGAFATVSGTF